MDEKTISLADLSSYRLVYNKDWERIGKLARGLSEERNMWKEKYEELKRDYDAVCGTNKEVFQENEELKEKCDELKRKYDLQKAENVTLAYINENIGGIAKAKCPEIAAFLERMKLMREQAIKDIMEKAKENAEEE